MHAQTHPLVRRRRRRRVVTVVLFRMQDGPVNSTTWNVVGDIAPASPVCVSIHNCDDALAFPLNPECDLDVFSLVGGYQAVHHPHVRLK